MTTIRRHLTVPLVLVTLLAAGGATTGKTPEQPGDSESDELDTKLGDQLRQHVDSLKGNADAARIEIERQRKAGKWDSEAFRRSHAAYREGCEASRVLLNRICNSAPTRSFWSEKQREAFDAEIARLTARLDNDCRQEKVDALERQHGRTKAARERAATAFENMAAAQNQHAAMIAAIMKAMHDAQASASRSGL